MQIHKAAWSRDWAQVSRTKNLNDGELMEYLRWMACNRPGKYAEVITEFMAAYGNKAPAMAL